MRSTTTEKLLRANRKRRFRTQSGTVTKRRDGYYLRFYTDCPDGTRRKVSERLCDIGVKAVVVKIKRAARMEEINLAQAEGDHSVPVDQTIADFWKNNYLPWCEANIRREGHNSDEGFAPSTLKGYKKLWAVLEPRIGSRSLQKFRRVEASDFLTSLVKDGWNDNSVKHAKFLLSGVYARAVSREIVVVNPMTGAKSDILAESPAEQVAYTNAEVVAILNALDRLDAKVLWALCAVLGTRPSEAMGLTWPCCSDDYIRIERAAPYGEMQEFTKSDRGKRQVLNIEPVRGLLKDWKAACGNPTKGLVFDSGNGQPFDHSVFVARWIAPGAKKACSRWYGIYGGRHATGTGLAVETGNASATHQGLGNSREVAERSYVHRVQEAGDKGYRLREAAILNEMQKTP